MQIAQVLAGYSLGGADLLRRAMGKKKPEEMAKQKADVHRRREEARASTPKIADQIFELDGVLRRLRLQQVALGRVRLDHVPDRVPQAPLPARVHGGSDVVRRGQHRQRRQVHRRGARDGPHRRAARHQRVASGLHGHAERGDARRQGHPLRPRRGEGRRRERGRGDPRGARDRGPVHVAVRAVPARRHAEVQPARARAADQERRARRPRQAAITARSCSRHSTARSSAARRSSAIARSGQTSLFGLFGTGEPAKPRGRRRQRRDAIPRSRRGGPSSCSRSRRKRSASTSRAIRSIAIAAISRATRRATTSDFSAGAQGAGRALDRRHRQPVPRDDHEEGRQDGALHARGCRRHARGDRVPEDVREGAPRARLRRADPVHAARSRTRARPRRPSGRCCSRARRRCRSCASRRRRASTSTSTPTAHARSDRRAQDDPRERDARRCQAVVRLKIAQRSETVITLPEAWAVSPTEDLLTRLERLFGDRVATLA